MILPGADGGHNGRVRGSREMHASTGRILTSRWRIVVRAIAPAVFAVLASACPGIEVVAPSQAPGSRGSGTGTGTGAGGSTTSSAIVGRWTRAVVFSDDAGNIHESRTTWEFRRDGSAIRTVTAWNVTSGVYDVLTAVAQWRTSGSTLTITWIAPASGSATFPWRVDGLRLTIGADEFTWVP